MSQLMGLHLIFLILTVIPSLAQQNINEKELPKEVKDLIESLPKVEPIQVLFLGSYHMSNPGMDAFNLESDDVLVPKRQAEIKEVVELLARFNPTKVAIESPWGDSLTIARYNGYFSGDVDLRRSEEEQIGFRLAKMMGHPSIYPIDVKMILNNEEIGKLIGEEPQKFGHYMATLEKMGNGAISVMGQWLKNGTIREMLYKMNDPGLENIAHELYFRSFIPIVKEDNYAGADMVSTWYQRNLRIFSNLHQITHPGDRVLVVFGQGHIPLLKQFANDSPYFEIVDTQKYLRE